jgi:uncharacterized protein YbjT (DUF2867 family)
MSFVLVTGATGEVGRGVVPLLESRFALRLLSLDPPGNDPRRVQADVLDREALTAAMRGAPPCCISRWRRAGPEPAKTMHSTTCGST